MIKTRSFKTFFVFILCLKFGLVNAEIFASKDQLGHIIYSNVQPKSTKMVTSPIKVSTKSSEDVFSAPNEKVSDFFIPKDAQTKRDALRKKILTDELNNELNNYKAAKERLDVAEANLHKNNIELLKNELNSNRAAPF